MVYMYVCMYVCVYVSVYCMCACMYVYHMWQSRVELEGYSVAYFDRIAAFEAPYR